MLELNGDSGPESHTPPVYFLSLVVEKFRCFKKSVTLDLSDGGGQPSMWNVLLGENGVGKTTLLQSLAMLEPGKYPNDGKQYEDVFVSGEARSEVPFHKWFFSGQQNNSGYIDSQTTVEDVVDHENRFIYRSSPGFVGSTIKDKPICRKHNVNKEASNLKVIAYGATRRMGKNSLAESLTKDSCATLFVDSIELINAEEWLVQADYATKTAKGSVQKRAQKRLEQALDLILGILPKDGVTDIRFGLNEDTAVMTPRVEAETPFGWVRLRDLSLGYQAALTWMVDLAARMLERYPDSPNPLAEPAIVLVDEIDLHLHPKWQRELITKLRTTFPKTQWIVTAHSPLIVQAAPDANIALLKRVGDHVEIENDVDRVRDWRVDQILTSDVFGLQSPYPEHIQQKLEERSRIATKSRLTAADRKLLAELDAEIDALPVGEVSEDRKALDALRRANAYFESTRK